MSRRDGLYITQNRALLNLWFASAREAAPVGSFACSMFGDPVDLQQIAPVNSNGVVLGGFEASRAHGLLHTIPGTPPSIHVLGNPMSMMKKGDFQFCDQGNAQLLIVDTKLKESVFRGAVDIDGLRVVDALQAALDVAPLPNRGIEQAEVIAERILQWRT